MDVRTDTLIAGAAAGAAGKATLATESLLGRHSTGASR